MTAPHRLRVEHLDEALGIDVRVPRFSWQLPAGTTRQLAYRVRISNGGDTGLVESAQSVLVPYAGPALSSGERVEWQVQVWTDLGASPWSEPAWFELGLLEEQDWQAVWVGPVEADRAEPGNRPAPLLRGEIDVAGPVLSARIHLTAHGIYEAFLNGARIGTDELTPGFTQYDARLAVQTYDVTELLQPGRNALGVILADGWYRGQIGITRAADQWGTELAVLAQLHLAYADGTGAVLGTGPHWRSSPGHVVAADLIAGERWDLARLPHGWSEPGFDDAGWAPVVVRDVGYDRLVGSPAPPVRRVEELTPVAVTRLDADRQVVDLGQNVNGWTRLERVGPAGTTVRLVHGEWLDATGDLTTEHLRPRGPLPARAAAGRADRRGHLRRRPRRGLRAAPHHARVPLRPGRGAPRRPDPRRRHRRRGAHRPAAYRVVLLQ